MTAGSVDVSVIVPARNAAEHLASALTSVATQNPCPAEIIVIDGDSADGSVAIAEEFPVVRVIRQTGRGLAAARNEAIKASAQPFIAFCDADDRWTPGALAARLDALAAHPEAVAVIGRVVLEEIAGTSPTAAQAERLGRSVAGFTPGALLARRAAFDRAGLFDESLSIGADSDWFVRLELSGSPALQIQAVVLRKGARGTSLSTNVADYRRELLTVARRFIESKRGKQ